MLPYKKVTFKWYDIYLSKKFTLGKDGKYHGIATVYQRFEGVNDNIELKNYSDTTKKTIELVLEKDECWDGVKQTFKWVLKLGDIKVEETRD